VISSVHFSTEPFLTGIISFSQRARGFTSFYGQDDEVRWRENNNDTNETKAEGAALNVYETF
jgi:hypothetical protein